MSLGARLREERQRLGMNQTAFALIAGASKRAMVNWEKDVSAPLATAVVAWSEAGADALYILTGRRSGSGFDGGQFTPETIIADVRADLLDPHRYPVEGETPDQAEARVLQHHVEVLQTMLDHAGDFGSPEQHEEARSLLAIAEDPARLTAFRAADHAQMREKRKVTRERIASWMELGDLHPSDTTVATMASLALEYGIPLGPLIELAYQLLEDGTSQRQQESG